jgi:hypothetical protein
LRRTAILVGALAFLVGLAFLVARPSRPDVATTPYAGVRGASRSRAAGLAVFYTRGADERAVEPATLLRAGDVLRFVVRGERPRHVEVRARDGDRPAVTLFPAAAGETKVVAPGESLPVSPAVAAGGGKLIVTALFSDAPRKVGSPPDADTEAVSLVVIKE